MGGAAYKGITDIPFASIDPDMSILASIHSLQKLLRRAPI